MFCLKCGSADQSMDSYCKRCGEWLPDTTHLSHRRGRLRIRTPEQRNRRMRVLEALSALAALSSAGLIISVLTGKPAVPLLVFAMYLCVITGVFQVVNFAIGRSLQKRLKQGHDEVSRTINSKAEGGLPQLNEADTSQLVQPFSVTESTTALLEPTPHVAGKKESR